MPMVKMKSGKTMKFPYTKKGKAAAKKVAAKKMVHGGGVTKAKAGASIPAAGKSKAKMATGGMVGKIRSSKVVGTEDEKDKKNMKGMKGMMGGGAMYGGMRKHNKRKMKMKDGGVASTTSKSEKDLKKGDMRQVRADMAKKKAAAMKKDRNK